MGAATGPRSRLQARSILSSDSARACAFHTTNMLPLAIFWLSLLVSEGIADLLRDSVHVTSAAARPNNDLWCYKCLANEPEDKCADLRHNNSALMHKCHNDGRMCMVKRFSYTTSTENTTTAPKMWALERNCTKHCDPGCIVIGERTKLYACTTCCTTSLCNYGSAALKKSLSIVICTLSLMIAIIL